MGLDARLLLKDCRNEDGRHSTQMQAAYCRLVAGATQNREMEVEATVNLARLLQNQFDPYAGLDVLDRLLERYPNERSALQKKGLIHNSLREFDEALATFSRMVEIDPGDHEALYLRGGAHCLRRDYEAAINDFNRSLAIEPESVMALSGRAAALSDGGEHEKALLDYDAAIRLDPGNHHHYAGRGATRLEAGRSGGVDDLLKSIEINDDNPDAYAKLGEVALSVRDDDPENDQIAHELLTRAAELNPCDGTTQMHLGRAEARLGNTDAAVRAFGKCIALIPELLIVFKAALASRGHYEGEINDEPDEEFWSRLRAGIENQCGFMEPFE